MALDATVAGVSANSYLTVAAADALAAERIGPDYEKWIAADVEEQEKALISATESIDAWRDWHAVPYAALQALVFPRVTDLVADAPTLPARIKLATFEQAVYLMANAKMIADSGARRARGLISFSEGDGSGTQAVDPTWGLMAPKAVHHISAVPTLRRSSLTSVPMRSAAVP